MRNRIRMVMIVSTLFFAHAFAAYGSDFEGLEGVVILTPDEGNTDLASEETKEGLVLSLNGNTVEKASDTYANIILQVGLMNWDISDYQISEAVSAKLYYQDQYEFDGTVDFDEETEIGMLVNLDGTVSFMVPYIVAAAEPEELRLEFTVLDETYEEDLDISQAGLEGIEIPFQYASRQTDEMELSMGPFIICDKWNGEKDEKYKWIVQDIYLINWSTSVMDLGNSLSVLLTYMDTYGFEAQQVFPQDQLHPLETVKGQLVYHVPVIITTAEDNTLGLQIELQGSKWDEAFDIKNAGTIDYWELLSEVFPYSEEDVMPRYDPYAENTTECMWEWDGHIYMIVNINEPSGYYYNRTESIEYCEAMGGHLATITSQEEQDIIEENIEKYAKYERYWIGGTLENNQWVWLTGEAMEYSNWGSGEPNGSGEYMDIYPNGIWDDTHGQNNKVKGYICEWDL